MPRNNPYDQEMSPRRQLVSNIFFVLIILVLAAFILWVIFSQPKNVRTDFDPVQMTVIFSGEESEFFSLYDALDTPCGISPAFLEHYPIAAALLQRDASIWDEQKPYVQSAAGGVTLAYSYTGTTDESIVTMDVLAFPGRMEGERYTLSAPLRYTVEYNRTTGAISKTDLRTDRYRLSFYRLSLSFRAVGEASCTLSLSSVVSDREAEAAGLPGGFRLSPEGTPPALARLDGTSEITGSILPGANGQGTATLSFDDFLYDAFGGLTVSAPGLEGVTLSLNAEDQTTVS